MQFYVNSPDGIFSINFTGLVLDKTIYDFYFTLQNDF